MSPDSASRPAYSIGILCCIACAVWWMSAHVVWLGDDLDYKYMMKGEIWESWGKIRSWHDVWLSQCIHYRHVNGRFVAHFLVQLFNGIYGQQAFAICNAAVYSIFALMIARIGKVKLSENPGGVFTAAAISTLCFVTKMMPTCQIGYIWAMTANMVWLSLFFSRRRPSWAETAAMTLLGVAIGNWQESISLGVCACAGYWWLSQFCRRREKGWFDWHRSWMLLGYVAGTATVCFAPSTLSRVSSVETSFTDQLLVAMYSLPAVFLLLIATAVTVAKRKELPALTLKCNNGGIPGGCMLAAVVFLLLFNFAVGIYSNRQLFGANMFAAVLTLRILPRHRLPITLNAIAGAAVAALWTAMYIGIGEVRRQYDEISALHSISADGTVEYNRERVMILGHPSDAKYYEDIIGQFDNDLHHSMMKDFKQTKGGRTLKLKPTTLPQTETIVKYAPGHFNVATEMPKDGKEPKEIAVYGHYTLLGVIEIPASPRILKVGRYSRRRPPYGTATIIPEYPLFTADSISFHL